MHTAQGSLGPQTAVAGDTSMNNKFKIYSLANKTFDTAIKVTLQHKIASSLVYGILQGFARNDEP